MTLIFGATSAREDYVEFALLFSSVAACSRATNNRNRCSSGYAELFFDGLDGIIQFKNGHALDGFQDTCNLFVCQIGRLPISE